MVKKYPLPAFLRYMLTATVNDTQLDAKIIEFSAFTGKSVRDVGETVIKGLIKDVINITPPATGKADKSAQRAGEAAIVRDLNLMGFRPVTIKGYKEYKDTFWGHKLKNPPLRIKTKPNPRFADPAGFHANRLAHKHGGRVTQGGKQPFYVERSQFVTLRKKLFSEVGNLAAGWIPAADRFGVPVPAWIRRHGNGNGGSIEVSYDKGIRIRAVNHFPETAATIAGDTQRRIETVKGYAIAKLTRQLSYLMKKGWRKS